MRPPSRWLSVATAFVVGSTCWPASPAEAKPRNTKVIEQHSGAKRVKMTNPRVRQLEEQMRKARQLRRR